MTNVSSSLFFDRLTQGLDLPDDSGLDLPSGTPVDREALGALCDAIILQDPKRVEALLKAGVPTNVRLNPTPWTVNGQDVPPTPLGLALWLVAEHTDHLPSWYQRDDNGRIVTALLAAGAEPHPEMAARFVQDGYHPACEALQVAVLDRMGAGHPLPGTVWTLADRQRWNQDHPGDEVPSVMPVTFSRVALHWLHQAIEKTHRAAFDGWFAQGGVVGLNSGTSAAALLWTHMMGTPRGEEAPTREAMLTTVRAHLLGEPSFAVYRKEMMSTLVAYAKQTTWFQTTDPAMERCMVWLEDLVRERSLRLYQIPDVEAFALDVDPREQTVIQASLNRLEQVHLRQVMNAVLDDPAAPPLPDRSRPRL